MSVRVFVGNLAYDVTEAELKEFFAPAGAPLSVRMPTDRETGKPRGFAFVEFSEAAQADEAVRRFHQQVFKGRPLVVNEARPREEGAGPRSSGPGSFGRSSAPSGPGAPERSGRPDQPTRTFGPDAPRRGTRKSKGYGAKGERAPKRPLRERVGGQFFAGAVDDSQGDQGVDDAAFWARAASENQDEE
jgi:RNA recognition motif-containing protein